MSHDPWTYFGLWGERDVKKASTLLTSLGVRFEIFDQHETEKRLKDWCAWDPTSTNPNTGFNLYIHDEDLDKVGYKIVEMFPERKFEKATE